MLIVALFLLVCAARYAENRAKARSELCAALDTTAPNRICWFGILNSGVGFRSLVHSLVVHLLAWVEKRLLQIRVVYRAVLA